MFFETALHQGNGERSPVDGQVELADQKWDGSDVIFMPVRQDQGPDLVAVVFEVGEVGNYNVDPEQFGIREHHSGIDDDHVGPIAQGQAVHAELAESPKGNNLELVIGHTKAIDLRLTA